MRLRQFISAQGIAGIIGLVIVGVHAPVDSVASGQVMVTSEAGFGGPGMGLDAPPVSTSALERYLDILEADEAQREVAKALLESMQSEHMAAARAMQDQMRDLSAEFQETQDHAIFANEMPAIMEAFRDRAESLEQSFFRDFRALMTAEQIERWPAVERTKRRITTINDGMLSGESVDLIELIESMELPEDLRAEIRPVLGQYELELDRALQTRNEVSQSGPSFGPGRGMMRLDSEEFQKMLEESREASAKVRDVNRRFARQVESMLPQPLAGEFAAEFRSRSFPTVYRPSYTQKIVGLTGEFDDLSPEQRETIAAIQAAYERELATLNDQWARAIEESEESGSTTRLNFGGHSTMIRLGEESGSPVDEARSARRELDNRTLDRIKAMLSAEQRARLPERREMPERFGGGAFETVEGDVIILEVQEGGPAGP